MSVKDANAEAEFAGYEAKLIELAAASVRQIEPFDELLAERAGELWIGYRHNLRRTRITRRSADAILHDTLKEVVPGLRRQLWPLLARGLDVVRASALVHIAMISGCDRLSENMELWRMLAKKDYRAASEALLMTEWPQATDALARRRVPRLALTLFSGEAP